MTRHHAPKIITHNLIEYLESACIWQIRYYGADRSRLMAEESGPVALVGITGRFGSEVECKVSKLIRAH
jgi:hypothetical protein